MSMFTSRVASNQAILTDPASVWDLSKRILFNVAKKVHQSIRVKLEGHGRGEAEPEELVNDAFIWLMEALPRFNPATSRFTTFVYGLARRRMWLMARVRSMVCRRSRCIGWMQPSEHSAITVASKA